MDTMKLTYSQKRYIQKHYPKESVEMISKRKKIPEDLILQHVTNHKRFVTKSEESIQEQPKFIFKEHVPYFILFFVFILIVYANGFGAEFVSDDVYAILRNENAFKEPGYLFAVPTFIIRAAQYLISYTIGGLTPFAFRIWNILFHLGFVWMTYLIVPYFSKKKFLPFIVASFAAVHPMMTESVTWISGGIYAQAGFGILTSFYFYLRFKSQKLIRYIAYSILAFIISLSASEKVIVFPFIIGLYEFTFGSVRKSWILLGSYFSVSFIWGLIILTRVQERIEYLAVSQGKTATFNVENPFFQIPAALGTYIKLFIWPRHLTLYQSEFRFSPFQFLVLLSLTLLFFGLIMVSFRKNKSVFFWLSFFIITLLPTLNPFGLSWLVAERYSYLGSIGLFFVFSVLLSKLIDSKTYKSVGYIIFTILLLSFSVRTIVRNIDWQNEDKLWIATGKASPSDPKTHNNLGDYYARIGDLQSAAQEFSRAIELSPSYPDAHHNLANIFRQAGKNEEAEKYYLKAVELNPALWQSYQNIAAMYFEKGDFETSEKYTLHAIEVYPTYPELYVNLGTVYMNKGENELARKSYQKALELDPTNETALKGMRGLSQ